MNISASILVICSLFVYAHAHVVLSDWEVVADDVICPRPSIGPCSLAGACCGQKEGTQRLTRTCEEDHCGEASLSMTRKCTIRCNEVDKNSWGEWTPFGNCRRPAEGRCSSPGTCCSELQGTMTLTTTCESDKGCVESKLTKDVRCNIRCGGFTQFKRAGNCVRPTEGRCASVDSCCGEREGTMKFVRQCKVAGECDASKLERTRMCNLRCGVVNPCDLYPNPCKNGGTCVKDGHSHSCSCPPGWKGHHCETIAPKPEPECDPACVNGGTCVAMDGGPNICSCPDGYVGGFGKDCSEEEKAPEVAAHPCDGIPCSNGATCVKGDGDSYTCDCTPGWMGPRCQEIDG